ncbi:FAD-linked oxidase [Flexivirga endophytica]|uniref:FAD-linked oxidase n=1 Tax=Flexivirga endophytica TaxID=1849103 RepID=A0A916WYX8_9MICO|nr:FAD-binding oxidoreductase [Flexivirga endophytica]GGB40896.1 FAD-linked oxidase [Flexivirga endophytica]GHB48678.1 FAD-linked oxidase [Flexivirga endophytica]
MVALTTALRDTGIDAADGTPADALDGQVPACVARPTSTEQVAAVLREASARDAVTVVRGKGTKQTLGGVCPATDLLIDTSAMDRLIEHQPGDLIVRVEAGMPLAALQEHVRASGQRLGLDEPVPGGTVGGALATNTSGAHRLQLGTARDLLIGVTVVLADGTVARSGGKVVKNVAGYDLGKLLVGSYGTLAVITEATFRLHPVPDTGRWVSATVRTDALEPLLARLCDSQLAPAALEIDWQPHGSATIALLLEGTTDGVAGRVEAATAEFAMPTTVDVDLDWPWSRPRATDDPGTLLKLTCRLGAVAEIATAAVELGLHLRGSAGTGVLYAAAPADASAASIAGMLQLLRPLTARSGGAAVVVTAPLAIRHDVDVWGPVSGLPIMRRLKEQFDPGRLLAPGRFVGGI